MLARIVAILSLVLWVTPSLVGASRADSQAALERIRTLVGTWDVKLKGKSGAAQTVTYHVTGGGRVIVEEFSGGMATTYHMDGDRLMLTHYCGAGNQPRMRITETDDKRTSFEMFDITNLASPEAYRSTRLTVVFLGENRVDLEYGGLSGGRESTQVFELTRRQ
jgi:hypothetical protein